MKSTRRLFAALACVALAAACTVAQAQTYPFTTSTYIPTAQKAAASFSAAGDYTFTAQNIGTVTLRVTGTCTGLTAAPQGTSDGTNWTTLNAYPVPSGSGPAIQSVTGTGFWRLNAAGFTAVRLHITVLSAACSVQMAGTPAQIAEIPADPCQNASIVKSSAVVNVGAATTTKLVDVSGTKAIYVCGFTASLAGTTPSVTFKYGTNVSTDCDTGATALSGVILPTSGSMVALNGQGTIMATPAAKQLCATTVGTGSSLQGVVSYVQQ